MEARSWLDPAGRADRLGELANLAVVLHRKHERLLVAVHARERQRDRPERSKRILDLRSHRAQLGARRPEVERATHERDVRRRTAARGPVVTSAKLPHDRFESRHLEDQAHVRAFRDLQGDAGCLQQFVRRVGRQLARLFRADHALLEQPLRVVDLGDVAAP